MCSIFRKDILLTCCNEKTTLRICNTSDHPWITTSNSANLCKKSFFFCTGKIRTRHVLFRIDHCRIMSSARRPLWLRWTNGSDFAEHYFPTFDLIFKHGDGRWSNSDEGLTEWSIFSPWTQISDKTCWHCSSSRWSTSFGKPMDLIWGIVQRRNNVEPVSTVFLCA